MTTVTKQMIEDLTTEIDCFGDGDWWKDEDKEIFIKYGTRMMEYGIPLQETALILEDLYYAVSNEFGM